MHYPRVYFLCYPIGVYCVLHYSGGTYDPYCYHIQFLGSGKTTFLQHILKEHKSTDKILIIENDFGETSLDAANLAAKTGLLFVKLHLAVFAVAYKETSNKHSLIFCKITM